MAVRWAIEGVGIIEETGNGVTNFKKGDHVLISCITLCGKCEYCKKGMHSYCVKGGWILGNMIEGNSALNTLHFQSCFGHFISS